MANKFNKDAVIVAQNATMPAVQLASAIIQANAEHPTTTESALALYDAIHEHIFTQSMLMGGVESVEEFLEAAPHAASAPKCGGYAPKADRNGAPGDVAFNSGKHRGKTIAEVHAEEPDYLTWAAANMRNDFMVTRIRAFLGEQS